MTSECVECGDDATQMVGRSTPVCETCAAARDWLAGSREAADSEADLKAMMAQILRGNA